MHFPKQTRDFQTQKVEKKDDVVESICG